MSLYRLLKRIGLRPAAPAPASAGGPFDAARPIASGVLAQLGRDLPVRTYPSGAAPAQNGLLAGAPRDRTAELLARPETQISDAERTAINDRLKAMSRRAQLVRAAGGTGRPGLQRAVYDPAEDAPSMQLVACPPGDRNCIEAPSYDPRRDRRRTVRSNPAVDEAARANLPSIAGGSEERFGEFTRGPGGEVVFTERQGRARTRRGVTRAEFPAHKGVPIAHSHPFGSYELYPGPEDNLALDQGHPSYVVQGDQQYVIEVVDGQLQARLISGHFSEAERREIRDRLKELQRASRRTRR